MVAIDEKDRVAENKLRVAELELERVKGRFASLRTVVSHELALLWNTVQRDMSRKLKAVRADCERFIAEVAMDLERAAAGVGGSKRIGVLDRIAARTTTNENENGNVLALFPGLREPAVHIYGKRDNEEEDRRQLYGGARAGDEDGGAGAGGAGNNSSAQSELELLSRALGAELEAVDMDKLERAITAQQVGSATEKESATVLHPASYIGHDEVPEGHVQSWGDDQPHGFHGRGRDRWPGKTQSRVSPPKASANLHYGETEEEDGEFWNEAVGDGGSWRPADDGWDGSSIDFLPRCRRGRGEHTTHEMRTMGADLFVERESPLRLLWCVRGIDFRGPDRFSSVFSTEWFPIPWSVVEIRRNIVVDGQELNSIVRADQLPLNRVLRGMLRFFPFGAPSRRQLNTSQLKTGADPVEEQALSGLYLRLDYVPESGSIAVVLTIQVGESGETHVLDCLFHKAGKDKGKHSIVALAAPPPRELQMPHIHGGEIHQVDLSSVDVRVEFGESHARGREKTTRNLRQKRGIQQIDAALRSRSVPGGESRVVPRRGGPYGDISRESDGFGGSYSGPHSGLLT